MILIFFRSLRGGFPTGGGWFLGFANYLFDRVPVDPNSGSTSRVKRTHRPPAGASHPRQPPSPASRERTVGAAHSHHRVGVARVSNSPRPTIIRSSGGVTSAPPWHWTTGELVSLLFFAVARLPTGHALIFPLLPGAVAIGPSARSWVSGTAPHSETRPGFGGSSGVTGDPCAGGRVSGPAASIQSARHSWLQNGRMRTSPPA